MSETQQAIEWLLNFLLREKNDVENLPLRLEKQAISTKDRQYLGLILGLLNKLFGEAAVLNRKARANVQLNNETCALFDSYESTLSADALAEKFQPLFDSLLQGISQGEKERLLTRVDAISQVLEDSVLVARLALVWSYINAVLISSPSELAKRAPMPSNTKKQVLNLLVRYHSHLYNELRKAWPHRLGIATNPSGQVLLLNAQGMAVNEKRLPKNLLLLKQKYQVTNESLRFLRSKTLSLPRFRYHFNYKMRPVIIQQRTSIDNELLQSIKQLVMKPLRAVSSFFHPRGMQFANRIQPLLIQSNTMRT